MTSAFSIIIPVYNVEAYLRDCLESVRDQSFTNWEAICVNDGSTDRSLAILEDYSSKDKRFKIINQSNGGLSVARNAGLDLSKGDYVLFLDSDDWLEKNTLAVLNDRLNGEDMLCFSGRRYLEKMKAFNKVDQLAENVYGFGMDYYNENALLQRDFAFVCVVLRAYRRAFLIENNLRFKEGIYHEDNLFTPMACYYARNVKVVNECLYDYRVRVNSITTTGNLKRIRDLLGVANTLAAFFVPKQGFDKTVIYRAITHHYQLAFDKAVVKERKELKRLCDWSLYFRVSGTKFRHRVYYLKNRIGV